MKIKNPLMAAATTVLASTAAVVLAMPAQAVAGYYAGSGSATLTTLNTFQTITLPAPPTTVTTEKITLVKVSETWANRYGVSGKADALLCESATNVCYPIPYGSGDMYMNELVGKPATTKLYMKVRWYSGNPGQTQTIKGGIQVTGYLETQYS